MGFPLSFHGWTLPLFILASAISVTLQIGFKQRWRNTVKKDAERQGADDGRPAESRPTEAIGLEKRKPSERWNTALFFPPIRQRRQKCSSLAVHDTTVSPSLESGPETPFSSIAFYFENAVQSIQICALLFSEFELANIIQRKRNRGLLIQVITDHDTLAERNGSMNNSCRHLRKIGVPVQTKISRHLMHNKFVIFDEEAVLTGSLNFTKKAIRDGTFENVVVTTDKRIVNEYIKQFRLLWRDCREGDLEGRGGGGQFTGPSKRLSPRASNDSLPTFPTLQNEP